jgi:hypothetical protein
MFIKRCTRNKNGKPHAYWQLVESYRTARGPRQRTVAYLGELSACEKHGWARLAVSADKVNDTCLYRTLDAILPLKPKIEMHLKQRIGELFAPEFELLLYDVTSTYFEGRCKANPQARYGYSPDHRPDCKQVCIALVAIRDGFPLGYEVFTAAVVM